MGWPAMLAVLSDCSWWPPSTVPDAIQRNRNEQVLQDKSVERKIEDLQELAGDRFNVRFGSKAAFAPQKAMSALHPKADMCGAPPDVC